MHLSNSTLYILLNLFIGIILLTPLVLIVIGVRTPQKRAGLYLIGWGLYSSYLIAGITTWLEKETWGNSTLCWLLFIPLMQIGVKVFPEEGSTSALLMASIPLSLTDKKKIKYYRDTLSRLVVNFQSNEADNKCRKEIMRQCNANLCNTAKTRQVTQWVFTPNKSEYEKMICRFLIRLIQDYELADMTHRIYDGSLTKTGEEFHTICSNCVEYSKQNKYIDELEYQNCKETLKELDYIDAFRCW